MKTLTTITKDNDTKYSQLRDKLVELNIISKDKKRYVPTSLALAKEIALEHNRFDNENAFSINYQYDE